jgi:hypothetical protein
MVPLMSLERERERRDFMERNYQVETKSGGEEVEEAMG